MRASVAVLLAFVLAGPVAAQPDRVDRAFQQGNEAYAEGRYQAAIDAYRSVLDAGYTSAELYYNLGTAYYRAGETGQAIRFYEKARRLRPGDARIRHNLEQARERVPGATAASPPSWMRVVDDWPPLPLFLAAVLLLAAGGGVAVVRSSPDRDGAVWTHPATAVLLAAGLGTGAVALGVSYVHDAHRRAVVIADRAPLRASPSTATADTVLPEGALLHVPRPSADAPPDTAWTRVRLSNGTTGWVPTPALGPID